jgi:hypothetical protein
LKSIIRPLINPPITIKLLIYINPILTIENRKRALESRKREQHTEIKRERNDLRERKAIVVKKKEIKLLFQVRILIQLLDHLKKHRNQVVIIN